MLCHLQGEAHIVNGGLVAYILHCFGYLSVSMFFFLSGYGLMTQLNIKGDSYIKAFPKKRILPFYLNCLVLIVLYSTFNIIVMGESIGFSTILKSLTFGGTIIRNGWYLQVILLFYVIFYLAFRLLKKPKISITTVSISLVLFCIISYVFDFPTTWYEAIFSLLFGIIWAVNKEKIEGLISSRYMLSLVVAFLLFAMTFGLAYVLNQAILKLIFKMISSPAFCLLTIIVTGKININNKATQFLGKYSFEIYVMQGMCMEFFHSRIVNIENSLAYTAVTIPAIIVVAMAIHPLFNIINRKIKGR